MQLYLSSRAVTYSTPLYVFGDGTYLTCYKLTRFLSMVLQDCSIRSHSFRIGGATALAAAGYPDTFIQTIGRWSSDCFRQYIRLPPALLQSYTRDMCARL